MWMGVCVCAVCAPIISLLRLSDPVIPKPTKSCDSHVTHAYTIIVHSLCWPFRFKLRPHILIEHPTKAREEVSTI